MAEDSVCALVSLQLQVERLAPASSPHLFLCFSLNSFALHVLVTPTPYLLELSYRLPVFPPRLRFPWFSGGPGSNYFNRALEFNLHKVLKAGWPQVERWLRSQGYR